MTALAEILIRRIREDGPMTVASYMTECLMHPEHGYYTTRPPFGAQGDFVTAPEISQMFGELIGLWAVETWNRLGAPERFRLVEVGPGDGTLMSDALRAAHLVPGFLEACDLILIEPSAPLRDLQAKALAGADLSPRWVRSLTAIETDAPVILIANEVLDCMPARQFVRTDGGWAERRIGVWLALSDTADGLTLSVTDEDGCVGSASVSCEKQAPQDATQAEASLRENLGKLGNTIFSVNDVSLTTAQPWFVPASVIKHLRRDAVEALEAARAAAYERPQPGTPVEPPVAYPEDTLSYLANVFNQKAHDFYAKHGVKVIAAAYESHEEHGEVSLMITKHCVRFSLSLCPKQAKGVTGVQGTVKAEPMTITHGNEKLTLRFDCKPCEMHVVGQLKAGVPQSVRDIAQQTATSPIRFYRTRPVTPV